MANVIDTRFRSGQRTWAVQCDGLSAEQNKLACEVRSGTIKLPAVNFSSGDAIQEQWGANKVEWPDVEITFLESNITSDLREKAMKVGLGKDGGKFRANISVISRDTGGNEQMRINYANCQIVNFGSGPYVSTASGQAKTEKATFRPLTIEVVG